MSATGRGTVNKVMLIGHLGADPELRYTPSGAAVATFNIATNQVWKDGDGNQQEKTEWHRVVMWRRQAEVAAEYLKKGSKIYVDGHLQTRSWEDKDGVKKYSTEVITDQFVMLDSKGGGGSSGVRDGDGPSRSSEPAPPPQTSDEDDLPF